MWSELSAAIRIGCPGSRHTCRETEVGRLSAIYEYQYTGIAGPWATLASKTMLASGDRLFLKKIWKLVLRARVIAILPSMGGGLSRCDAARLKTIVSLQTWLFFWEGAR